MERKVAIVGAGIGGVSTAILLAKAGFEVDVFEANPSVGGKARERNLMGYRFDMGPSVVTMLDEFESLFDDIGIDLVETLKPKRLDLQTKYFWPDGSYLEMLEGAEIQNANFDVDTLQVKDYATQLHRRYENIGQHFLNNSHMSANNILSSGFVTALWEAFKMPLTKTTHRENSDRLGDSRLIQLFDRYATYIGADPYKTNSMFNMIAGLELMQGSYVMEGGVYGLVRQLHKAAIEAGVKFFYSTRVRSIKKEAHCLSVVTDQGEQLYDLVVSNVDRDITSQELLGRGAAVDPAQLSMSAYVIYLGVKDPLEALGHHNIIFAADYKREFDHISRGLIYDDPTVYVNITSKSSPDDSPGPDFANPFVMVNLKAQEYSQRELSRLRDKVMSKISHTIGTDITKLIEYESVMTPVDFAQQTGAYQGSLYGRIPTGIRALSKPGNRDPYIKNLYYVGGTVHPGGGMPLVVKSARQVSASIIKEYV